MPTFQNESEYWVIFTAFIMPLVMSGILIWFLLLFQKKKFELRLYKQEQLLKQQQVIIEKQQAIDQERTRIASEMHDDLGSGLTTIRYLSDKALTFSVTEEEKTQIRKIANQSNSLVRNMSEIIWALNGRYDSLGDLTAYVRRYASEYLEEYKIALKWIAEDIDPTTVISSSIRRNLFLVCKESLHNIVKHAQADAVGIEIKCVNQVIEIIISDNGVGFDPVIAKQKGNGLYNMQKRMKAIDGTIEFLSTKSGSRVVLKCELMK